MCCIDGQENKYSVEGSVSGWWPVATVRPVGVYFHGNTTERTAQLVTEGLGLLWSPGRVGQGGKIQPRGKAKN
jgi:hypothetical protein